MPSREYFLNADFDVSLRRGAPSLLESSDATFVHEMAWHFLFAAGADDSLILHRPLPSDFIAYLSAKGFALPRMVSHPDLSPASRFTPFGWNAHAESRNLLYDVPTPHPSLAAVKTANSRAFSLALELAWGEAGETYRLFDSLADLEAFLAENPRPPGWMIKGDHGHAGTANRHVPDGPLAGQDGGFVTQLLRDHGRIVVEPWHDRLLDMSANFTVKPDGGIADFRGHELCNSRDGAFLGVRIFPDRRPPAPWSRSLEIVAGRLGLALQAVGYFGPVSMDAYVHDSAEGPRLRALVDVNARHSMALPIHGLADRLPGKNLLWIWTKPRKLSLPAGYPELDSRLGEWAFDRDRRTGILAVSPLLCAPKPRRIGFLFCAEGEEDLAGMRRTFAATLGRR